jgi:hypothetical protein
VSHPRNVDTARDKKELNLTRSLSIFMHEGNTTATPCQVSSNLLKEVTGSMFKLFKFNFFLLFISFSFKISTKDFQLIMKSVRKMNSL